MPVTGRLRHRLVQLLRSERGQALPTALFAMIASFGLASAAVIASVDAQQGTSRDRESKNAIAAADAGANVALLRLNRFENRLPEVHCVGPGGEPQTPSGGWCPATPAESVGGASFSYMVSAYKEGSELSVVAVGTAGGVSRRVEVGLASYGGKYPFADEQLVGQNDIIMNGGVYIHTSIGTNGSIVRKGTSGEICGEVRVGVGQTYPEELCKRENNPPPTEADKNLPAIVPPENLATMNAENGTCRLEATPPKGCGGVDTYNKNRTSKEPWAPGTGGKPGTINVGQSATLTMGGENYLVCGLFVNNGQLIMANEGHVRIFVDTPEHCGLSAGATQVEITGNANIKSTGYNPAEGKYEVPIIYMLGSPTVSTKAKLCGNSGTNELILYAPNSDVEMCGNATWIGMIAGKSLTVGGNPTIEYDPRMKQPTLTTQTLWGRTHYVECTGTAASPPNASC